MIRNVKRKDGTTRWEVYGRVQDGRKIYVASFQSQREALAADEKHRVTQRAIAAGEAPAELDLKRTLRAAVEEWLASLSKQKSRSHAQYNTRMNRYVLPILGDVPIAKVAKSNVMRWRDDHATRFAPATVNGNLTCLSSAFSYFVDRDWIATNPCHGVSQVVSPDRIYTWVQTREGITKLLAECPKGIRELAIVALGTGMRLDEVLHLQWADVDLEHRLISVHRGRQGTVKSGKARRIPILNTLRAFFRDLALKRDGAVLVFPGRDGKPRSKPGVWYPFKQAAERAGFTTALRFHDLRHTFASHWVLDGGDIFRLSKILGHSSVVITQDTYAHLVPEMWEQDYHRVSFVLPDTGSVYALTRRKIASPSRATKDDYTAAALGR